MDYITTRRIMRHTKAPENLEIKKMAESWREAAAADNEGASARWSSCTGRSSRLRSGDHRLRHSRHASRETSLPVSPRTRPSSSTIAEGEPARPSSPGAAGGTPMPRTGDRVDSGTALEAVATASEDLASGSGGRRRGGRRVGGGVMVTRRGVGGPTMTEMKTRTRRKSLLGFGRRWSTTFGSSRYVPDDFFRVLLYWPIHFFRFSEYFIIILNLMNRVVCVLILCCMKMSASV